MDPAVLAAQRSYGSFLQAAPGAERQIRREEARTRYRALLSRARSGARDAQNELARLLSEPRTMSDVDVDPVEILICCPPEWLEVLLSRTQLALPLLVNLVEQLTEVHRDVGPALRQVMVVARGCRDPETLRWASDHVQPLRRQLFDLLGRLLLEVAGSFVGTVSRDEGALAGMARIVQEVDGWVEVAPTYSAEASLTAELAHISELLKGRRAYDEGTVLLTQMRSAFELPVTDLAAWISRVEHLCRLTEEWRSSNRRPANLAQLYDALDDECRRARNYARPWGQEHMALQGFGPTQILPPPPGACPYCASWRVGRPFCTQCGARL